MIEYKYGHIRYYRPGFAIAVPVQLIAMLAVAFALGAVAGWMLTP